MASLGPFQPVDKIGPASVRNSPGNMIDVYKRRLIQMLVSVVMCAAFSYAGFAQNCKDSGASAWNQTIRDVIADCASEFLSPNKRLLLKFAPNGGMSIAGKTIHLRGPRVEAPAMVSWSPKSDVFFVNDGEGSGMTSTFRLFRVNGTQIYEDKAVEKAAVSLYRRVTGCNRTALDPNVYGFGWAEDGSKIYLLVQATVHEPCGSPYQFISLVVRTSDGKILETLTEEQTKERFGLLLPSSLFME